MTARRAFIGSVLGAATIASASVAPSAPRSKRSNGLVLTFDMAAVAYYLDITLDGVQQNECVVAQLGEDGMVIRYARDAQGHFQFHEGLGVARKEVVRGRVEAKLVPNAPEHAAQMFNELMAMWN